MIFFSFSKQKTLLHFIDHLWSNFFSSFKFSWKHYPTQILWFFESFCFGFRFSGNQIVTDSIGNKGVTTQKTVSPGVETLFWQDCDTKNEWRTLFPSQSCHNNVSTPGLWGEIRSSCIYLYVHVNGYIFPFLNCFNKEHVQINY